MKNIGYKVVTQDMKSLGLRKNPNILQYKLGEWTILDSDNIRVGSSDFGGIWVARTSGQARQLRGYMVKKHNTPTRIFEAELGEILHRTDYRIKTDKVKLLEEID